MEPQKDEESNENTKPVSDYVAPRIESVMTAEEVAREVQYAGFVATVVG